MPLRTLIAGAATVALALSAEGARLDAYPRTPARSVTLAAPLREVSGLAFLRDGRLVAHDDERAVLYVLEPRSGRLVARLPVAGLPVRGDYEDVTPLAGGLALLRSDGTVFLLEPGPATFRATRSWRAPVAAACDAEGLAAVRDTLFLACKHTRRGRVTIHRLLAATGAPAGVPLILPVATLAGGAAGFHPSALEADSGSGHLLLLAGRERRLAEVTRTGAVVATRRLAAPHRQPEGLALAADGRLYVADEGGADGAGRLSTYVPRRDR